MDTIAMSTRILKRLADYIDDNTCTCYCCSNFKGLFEKKIGESTNPTTDNLIVNFVDSNG